MFLMYHSKDIFGDMINKGEKYDLLIDFININLDII